MLSRTISLILFVCLFLSGTYSAKFETIYCIQALEDSVDEKFYKGFYRKLSTSETESHLKAEDTHIAHLPEVHKKFQAGELQQFSQEIEHFY